MLQTQTNTIAKGYLLYNNVRNKEVKLYKHSIYTYIYIKVVETLNITIASSL